VPDGIVEDREVKTFSAWRINELQRIRKYIANNPRQWEKEKKRQNC
jgi:hypothetical protein